MTTSAMPSSWIVLVVGIGVASGSVLTERQKPSGAPRSGTPSPDGDHASTSAGRWPSSPAAPRASAPPSPIGSPTRAPPSSSAAGTRRSTSSHEFHACDVREPDAGRGAGRRHRRRARPPRHRGQQRGRLARARTPRTRRRGSARRSSGSTCWPRCTWPRPPTGSCRAQDDRRRHRQHGERERRAAVAGHRRLRRRQGRAPQPHPDAGDRVGAEGARQRRVAGHGRHGRQPRPLRRRGGAGPGRGDGAQRAVRHAWPRWRTRSRSWPARSPATPPVPTSCSTAVASGRRSSAPRRADRRRSDVRRGGVAKNASDASISSSGTALCAPGWAWSRLSFDPSDWNSASARFGGYELVVGLHEEEHRAGDVGRGRGPRVRVVEGPHEAEHRAADVGRGGHERGAEHGAHRQAPVAERSRRRPRRAPAAPAAWPSSPRSSGRRPRPPSARNVLGRPSPAGAPRRRSWRPHVRRGRARRWRPTAYPACRTSRRASDST